MISTALSRLSLVLALTFPALATAQQAPPMRIRGAVEKLEARILTIKSSDGALVTVHLAPDFKVRTVVAQTLADIKPGEKVGITSIRAPDGVRRAIEIHIFPPDLRNVRTGEFPWDRGSDSLMTNAQVAEVDAAPQGGKIKISLNGKDSEIAVASDTPIVTYAPGDPALLKPGAAVFVIARKETNGDLSAATVTAEKNGVKPPM